MKSVSKLDEHLKAYVCIHVFNGSASVRLVTRPEGDWCFLCGEVHDDVASTYRVVGIGHLFDGDQTLREIQDLPMDWEAERENLGSPWIRTRIEMDG